MRHLTCTQICLTLLLVCTLSIAWDGQGFPLRKRLPRPFVDLPHLRHEQRLQEHKEVKQWLQNQDPLMGGALRKISMPPKTGVSGDRKQPQDSNSGGPIVSDVLPKTRGINIFASLTRDFESVESRLNDPSQNITVLAPRNSVIQDLPRKPWENPDDYERFGEVGAYEGEEGQDRAKRNLKRFVEAHIISVSPWNEGEEVETIGGDKLKWTKDGDQIKIQPGNVEVETVAEKVSNGEVWILNGVINYR
ncbi:FAS1 domain-containing protein [Aspergillus avenaceus]|uniref:FAS1 domain-containing protein n=1 Tax=Aspergillus avenaceus TaxID=36643 RepID=A0A5N6TPY4_ASPAV|nr:FAS1 domain-containing protein [Aspergillus avenaceus]